MRYLNYLRLVSFIKFCSGVTTETITDQDQKLLCMIHLIEDWFNFFHFVDRHLRSAMKGFKQIR